MRLRREPDPTPIHPRSRARGRTRITLAIAPAVALAGSVLAAPSVTAASLPTGWTSVAGVTPGRTGQATSVLADGRVLVTGGQAVTSTSGSTTYTTLRDGAVYDPATGTWKATKAPVEARTNGTAVTLTSGKVLLVGGQGAGTLASAELYNPTTNSWSPTASMSMARRLPVAVRLASGSVLVVGQTTFPRSVIVSAEVYDPSTQRWATTGDVGVPTTSGAGGNDGVLLPSGDVLTNVGMYGSTGGLNVGPRMYVTARNSWTQLSAPPVKLGGEPQLSLLPDGRVLFTGGATSQVSPSGPAIVTAVRASAILDPVSGVWTTAADRARADVADGSVITSLADGRVLSSGGTSTTDTDQVFDSVSGTWSTVPGMNRSGHSATLLRDGRVLAVGGMSDGESTHLLTTAALFTP